MTLYVGNLTKQVFELHFWVENTKKPIVVKIQPGSQANVYPQGSHLDHENIVGQHKMYGLTQVSEIDRRKEFVGHCYQFDTPIPLDRLFTTMERNDDMLYDQALERRKEAALAMDETMKRTAQETDTKLQNFEVELQEVEQKGVDTQVHEVITVGDGEQQQRRRGRPRRS
ncbi:hypothetical protein BGLT_02254 [Caballeronia glathei]|uniref:Uncharacterized protein n=1 Tax=Caballeronia glathei TaxID=60547 RepID=A0A069PME8_9BURK|nr:hypothetical protein [Caballeronia glathei]KDR41592.1 hypothetical protein BG61_16765 [Caballeronia glathei]CDY79473.1 hypothetical protein BGLT_02254 [Caballeronia glathei]